MKVHYLHDGVRHEGDAKNLSTLGAFIQTDGPAHDGSVDIMLQLEGGPLVIPCEVVDISDEGFSVAFSALEFASLERLASTLDMKHPSEKKIPLVTIDDAGFQDDLLDIQGEQWSPPVTEPRVHDWKPGKDLLTPPPSNSETHKDQSLPTLCQASNTKTAQQTENAPVAEGPTRADASSPINEAADKRQAVRHEMSIPVTFDNLTDLIKEFTHNISYGGMFVYTTEPIGEKTEIAVTLIHPVHGQRLTLLAKVVHASDAPNLDPVSGQPRYGLGIEFSLPFDELKRMLSDFIGSHQNQSSDIRVSQILNEARTRLELVSQSPYALLGLNEGSDQDQIRNAYFKLVDRFHPDRYFGKVTDKDRKILEELFRSLTEAYEELTV